MYRNLIFVQKKITSHSKTGQTKDQILYITIYIIFILLLTVIMTETRSKRRCKFVFFRIRINRPFRISKKYLNDYFNLFNFAFEEDELKKKKKNGNKIRRDPHKIANKVPNVLIAYFVMFYK